MIILENVNKNYQLGQESLQVLKNISLIIDYGELVGVIGASGSGKSTMMNILGLLDIPTTGEYYLDNMPTTNLTINEKAFKRNKYIGFIFQSFFLLPRLTALENVGLNLQYRDINKKDIILQSTNILSQVGMGKYLNHKPCELSGGQQQRVAIARALVGNPKLILADEPTGALDSKTSKDILELLISINHKTNATIVIITHDMEIANKCNRIISLHDGNII